MISVQPHVPATLPLLQSRSSAEEKKLCPERVSNHWPPKLEMFSHTKQRATVRSGIRGVHKHRALVSPGEEILCGGAQYMWALSTALGVKSPFIDSNSDVAPKGFWRLYTNEDPGHLATGVYGRITVYRHAFLILAQDGGERVRPEAGLDALSSSQQTHCRVVSHLPLPGDEPRVPRIVGVAVRTSCYIRRREHDHELRRTY